MSDISKFLNSFKDTELSRSTNYVVDIYPNTNFSLENPLSAANFGISQMQERLRLRCESAQLPSRTFSLVQQKTYGPIRSFPVQNSYENVTFSFICSDDMKEKKFFDSWMEFISKSFYTPTTITGAVNTLLNPRINFDFEYRDNYVTSIYVRQQDLEAKDVYVVELLEAYPISVNQVDLSWGNLDVVNKIQVTFNYRNYNRTL